jgi:proton-coupled amino acid transporter
MVLGRRAVAVGHHYNKYKHKQEPNIMEESAKAAAAATFQGTAFDIEEQDELLLLPSEEHQDKTRSKRNANHGISEWEAAASLAKAIMGAGSFALPWAFMQMGYIAGPIFMTLLMTLSVYSMKLLVKCSKHTAGHSYVDVARAAFGATGARCSYVASCSASIGVCGSYLVFIAANLQSLLENSIQQRTLILLVLPIAVSLSAVRDVKKFALASLLGDVSVVLGMAVVLVYGFLYRTAALGEGCVAVGSLETMPLALGAIGYLFLVHFLSLPIEASMAQPEKFEQVASVTFTTCAVLSGGFGIIGYLLFGEETRQIVLLNVQGSLFVSAVKLLLCVDLLLTYPVVMRPSIVILEQSLLVKKNKNGKQQAEWAMHMGVCVGLGLVAACSSIFVPAFGLLSGLVGGVSQTFLALVLPPLMLSQQQNPEGVWGLHGKDVVLVVFGIIMIGWTLFSTWKELGSDSS